MERISTLKYTCWDKFLKTQINGRNYYVHELEDSIFQNVNSPTDQLFKFKALLVKISEIFLFCFWKPKS